MCGVIGYTKNNSTERDIENIKRLLVETQIRGRHAAGISYTHNGRLRTEKAAVAAKLFIDMVDWSNVYNGGDISLVGHCRYSTSDLRYNQPLADDNISIVHNGIITQSLPETWEDTYGYKMETKNDSELLWNLAKEARNRFELGGSISAIELHSSGIMMAYRNGTRPLYSWELPDGGVVFTSTKDIMHRAMGTDAKMERCVAGTYYMSDGSSLQKEEGEWIGKDIQL